MANNFDNKLNKINKCITLNKNDRYCSTEDYNAVCDYVIENLRIIDPFFNKLFKGSKLCGSYADGLKISKPNEFDVNLYLKLRDYKLAVITIHPQKPGYVLINITNILKKIKGEGHNRDIYEYLLKFVDDEGNLLQNKIYSWFESIMTKMFDKYGKNFTKGNKFYELNCRKSGPAHTITVCHNERKIDIDIVPAFVFDKSQWIAERSCPNWIQYSDWTAIPKPFNGQHGNNTAFRTSYSDTERVLMENKYNMKNALKLIKKLRDCQKITNLRSYYIKTIFLWEIDLQPLDFWNKPAGLILIHMCEILVKCMEKKFLPFFWDKSENMLAILTDNQVSSMYQQLNSLTIKLKKYQQMNSVPDTFYNLFLNNNEIYAITCCDNIQETVDNNPTTKCTFIIKVFRF